MLGKSLAVLSLEPLNVSSESICSTALLYRFERIDAVRKCIILHNNLPENVVA